MTANLREPNRLSQTRKFGGKIYHWYSYQETLSEARKIANSLREEGRCARVVEIERGHLHPWIKQGESVHKKNYVIYYRRKA